jgi:hypothetical protein
MRRGNIPGQRLRNRPHWLSAGRRRARRSGLGRGGRRFMTGSHSRPHPCPWVLDRPDRGFLSLVFPYRGWAK